MASSLTKSWNMVGSNIKRLLTKENIRFKSSGQDCDLLTAVRNPKSNPCAKDKTKDEKEVFKSMWDNPKCCKINPCKDDPPRLDQLYYRSSNKAKRVYTRTWVNCPIKRIIRKKKCCLEDIKPAPMYRRTKAERPKTACKRIPVPEEGEPDCALVIQGKCPIVPLPCCRKSRVPNNCEYYPPPSKCKKVKAPFPSYSECERDAPDPLHPCECKCQYITPNCRAYAYEIRLKRMPKSKKAEAEC